MNTVAFMRAVGYDPQSARSAFQQVMALADDDVSQRQACVSDICAWLRDAWRENRWRQMEPGAKQLAGDACEMLRLRLSDPESPLSWCGLDLDLSRTIIRDLDLRGAHFAGGTADFSGSIFGEPQFLDVETPGRWRVLESGPAVSFAEARFTAGEVVFDDAVFLGVGRGGGVGFAMARFGGASVSFRRAQFYGGQAAFSSIVCSAGSLDFEGVVFREVGVSFARAEVQALSRVSFEDATLFAGSRVSFDHSEICGEVNFGRAGVYGRLSLGGAISEDGAVVLDSAEVGGSISFEKITISGRISLRSLQVEGGLYLERAELSGGDLVFDGTEISGGELRLDQIWMEYGTLSFADVHVMFDAVVYLPWGTYGESGGVPADSGFDGKSRWEFKRKGPRYEPGVIRNWGPFAPVGSAGA